MLSYKAGFAKNAFLPSVLVPKNSKFRVNFWIKEHADDCDVLLSQSVLESMEHLIFEGMVKNYTMVASRCGSHSRVIRVGFDLIIKHIFKFFPPRFPRFGKLSDSLHDC